MKKILAIVVTLFSAALMPRVISAQNISEPVAVQNNPEHTAMPEAESGTVVKMVPDNDIIIERTSDPQSPFFYDTLMMRYKAGDTTLTLEDYHYLYYGFALQDEYDPLVPIPAEVNIVAVFERMAEPDYSGMMEIITNAREVMERDPFSPSNLNYLTYAYGAIGDTLNESINHDRFLKVLKVIGASGDGLKEKTPMHIIRFPHAIDYLTVRGLEIAKRIVISREVELIELTEKDGKNRGYYFDYSRIYSKKPSRLPDKPKREWQIDGFPAR